mgnify:CR=1 FL=1
MEILPVHLRRLSELVGVISESEQKNLLGLLKYFHEGVLGVNGECRDVERACTFTVHVCV